MNKKVLTLCAGFLLAGSAFTSINAETLEDAAKKDGGYFLVYVNNQKEIATDFSGSGLLSAESPFYVEATEENKDNLAYLCSDSATDSVPWKGIASIYCKHFTEIIPKLKIGKIFKNDGIMDSKCLRDVRTMCDCLYNIGISFYIVQARALFYYHRSGRLPMP